MKSLMLKLLIITLSVNALLGASLEDKVLKFLKNSVSATKSYKITGVRVGGSQDVPDMAGWKVYFIKIDLDLVGKDKSISISDKVFTNGIFITKDLLDIDTGKSIKSNFVLDFDAKFYSDSNIIAGEKTAPNKIAVFSDPLCPFCMSYMPEVIGFVKKYPKQFTLYYYHFPLNIHPNSVTLIKASLVAKKKGIKDVDLKMYEEAFDFDKLDEKLALESVNKLLGTKITLEELNQKDILKHMEDDQKIVDTLGLSGTPRVFVNGKIDPTRKAYFDLVKK